MDGNLDSAIQFAQRLPPNERAPFWAYLFNQSNGSSRPATQQQQPRPPSRGHPAPVEGLDPEEDSPWPPHSFIERPPTRRSRRAVPEEDFPAVGPLDEDEDESYEEASNSARQHRETLSSFPVDSNRNSSRPTRRNAPSRRQQPDVRMVSLGRVFEDDQQESNEREPQPPSRWEYTFISSQIATLQHQCSMIDSQIQILSQQQQLIQSQIDNLKNHSALREWQDFQEWKYGRQTKPSQSASPNVSERRERTEDTTRRRPQKGKYQRPPAIQAPSIPNDAESDILLGLHRQLQNLEQQVNHTPRASSSNSQPTDPATTAVKSQIQHELRSLVAENPQHINFLNLRQETRQSFNDNGPLSSSSNDSPQQSVPNTREDRPLEASPPKSPLESPPRTPAANNARDMLLDGMKYLLSCLIKLQVQQQSEISNESREELVMSLLSSVLDMDRVPSAANERTRTEGTPARSSVTTPPTSAIDTPDLSSSFSASREDLKNQIVESLRHLLLQQHISPQEDLLNILASRLVADEPPDGSSNEFIAPPPANTPTTGHNNSPRHRQGHHRLQGFSSVSFTATPAPSAIGTPRHITPHRQRMNSESLQTLLERLQQIPLQQDADARTQRLLLELALRLRNVDSCALSPTSSHRTPSSNSLHTVPSEGLAPPPSNTPTLVSPGSPSSAVHPPRSVSFPSLSTSATPAPSTVVSPRCPVGRRRSTSTQEMINQLLERLVTLQPENQGGSEALRSIANHLLVPLDSHLGPFVSSGSSSPTPRNSLPTTPYPSALGTPNVVNTPVAIRRPLSPQELLGQLIDRLVALDPHEQHDNTTRPRLSSATSSNPSIQVSADLDNPPPPSNTPSVTTPGTPNIGHRKVSYGDIRNQLLERLIHLSSLQGQGEFVNDLSNRLKQHADLPPSITTNPPLNDFTHPPPTNTPLTSPITTSSPRQIARHYQNLSVSFSATPNPSAVSTPSLPPRRRSNSQDVFPQLVDRLLQLQLNSSQLSDTMGDHLFSSFNSDSTPNSPPGPIPRSNSSNIRQQLEELRTQLLSHMTVPTNRTQSATSITSETNETDISSQAQISPDSQLLDSQQDTEPEVEAQDNDSSKENDNVVGVEDVSLEQL